jgi:NAD+ kinase
MLIAIFLNSKTNPQNLKKAQEIGNILDKHKLEYLINPSEKQFQKISLAISVGGDGTVLYTANLLSKSKIPILGINFGHRGYLCQISKEDTEEKIALIAKKQYQIEEKTRIQASIYKSRKIIYQMEALNEISIGGINRTVHLNAKIKTDSANIDCNVIGDGLIIATKTGSTAYNINAGGPMLLTEAFTVLANNAFFESDFLLPITKSLVVSTGTTLEIKDISNKKANSPFIIADGQEAKRISSQDTVIIKKSKYRNYFITF